MRVPYAAKTLLGQAQQKYKSAKMEPTGDPDGFGRYRSVIFDKTSTKWLKDVLPVDDERIVDIEMRDGQMVLTFAATIVADDRTPFALGSGLDSGD